MRKLSLHLESLVVETFELHPLEADGGTVLAHQEKGSGPGYSCGETCDEKTCSTCAKTCAGEGCYRTYDDPCADK